MEEIGHEVEVCDLSAGKTRENHWEFSNAHQKYVIDRKFFFCDTQMKLKDTSALLNEQIKSTQMFGLARG